MEYLKRYNEWKQNIKDEKHIEELKKMSEKDIEDSFRKRLKFGTGGLRGILGLGDNRMNIYTVSQATQGLANFLNKFNSDEKKSVVIAYDVRRMSREFAEQSAKVLAKNGIKAYVFEDIRQTPALSFAVRHLKCSAGIVITASHNPKEYNGYKAYNSDGCQVTADFAEGIMKEIEAVDLFHSSDTEDIQTYIDKNLIEYIGEEVDSVYYKAINSVAKNEGVDKDIKVVYTPIHGTGLVPIRDILKAQGYKNVFILPSQEKPNGEFPTVEFPNPEEPSALKLSLEYAIQKDAELIIGTDPDCDRVSAMIKAENGEYILLTGNQIGALLIDYIIKTRDIPSNAVVIKTVVTSELGSVISKANNISTMETLTGFKYIGEKMGEFDKTGEYTFLFGYEESYGFLAADFVRDKDAVMSSMLIVEMAAYYKAKGKKVVEVLNEIYDKYGYYKEDLDSFTFKGAEGEKKIKLIMDKFKNSDDVLKVFPKVTIINDYAKSVSENLLNGEKQNIELPKSDVMKYIFDDGSWFAIRPSGTEPKIKFYYSVNASDSKISEIKLNTLKQRVASML